MESIRRELSIVDMEDWYRIKVSDILSRGGSRLLNIHGNSLVNLLRYVYPSYVWQEWKFERVPDGFWKDMDNQIRFFDWLAIQLNVQGPDDWYFIKV